MPPKCWSVSETAPLYVTLSQAYYLHCIWCEACNLDGLLVLLPAQVYNGSHALSTEDQPCHPVNVYGSSKLEAEQAIQVGRSVALLKPELPKTVTGWELQASF